jgi:hypothetical protein
MRSAHAVDQDCARVCQVGRAFRQYPQVYFMCTIPPRGLRACQHIFLFWYVVVLCYSISI